MRNPFTFRPESFDHFPEVAESDDKWMYAPSEPRESNDLFPLDREFEWDDERSSKRRLFKRGQSTRLKRPLSRTQPQIQRTPFRPRKRPKRRVIARPTRGRVLPLEPSPCICPAHGSEYVRWVQNSLNQVLKLNLPVNGVMDAATRSALRRFQEQQGLPVDGIAGPETKQALIASTRGTTDQGDEIIDLEAFEELDLGNQELENEVTRSSRDYIRWVQQALNKIMGLRLSVDGIIGTQTRSALRTFQKRQGLSVDGVLGPETKRALIAARKPSPGEPDSTHFDWEIFGEEFEIQGGKCLGFEIDSVNYIKWVQRSLNRILGSGLTVDGSLSTKYRNEVRKFQQTFGLEANGEVNRKTQDKLILANEKNSNYVEWAQKALNTDGAGLVPDGNIGSNASKTKKAIRAYQEKRKPALCVDGFLGAKTELFLMGESGTLPPGSIQPKPPEPGKPMTRDQLTEDEINALVWGLIGPPKVDIWKILKAVGTTIKAAFDGLTGAVWPLNPWEFHKLVYRGLTDTDKALAELCSIRGMAYALMDHATRIRRTQRELNDNQHIDGMSEAHRQAFVRGYNAMKTQLYVARTVPGLRSALDRLAAMPNKATAVRIIYDAMMKKYWNKGALGRKPIIRTMLRQCRFEYPRFKATCGPNQ